MKYDYMLTVIVHLDTDKILTEDELNDRLKIELTKLVNKDYLFLNEDYGLTGVDIK